MGTSRWSPVVVVAVAAWLAAVPGLPGDWKLGPGAAISSKEAEFRFRIAGYAQEDFRSFRNWTAGDEDTGTLRNDTSELRRVRIGFEARWKWFSAEFTADPRNDQNTQVKDAYGDIRFARAFHLRGGLFKLPVSREFLTPAARTDFVERNLLSTSIGAGRDAGVMAWGDITKHVRYDVGVFAGDVRNERPRAETTGAARVLVEPAHDLEVGLAASLGEVEAAPDSPGLEPRPKGLSGQSASGFEFFEPRFVNGRRTRLDLEVVYTPGPFGLRGELLRAREQRKGQGATFDDLPDVLGTGWAISATWLVTGESKKSSISPEHPLPHGPGAFEVGVRYEGLRFDDAGPDEGFEGVGNRARNIRPAEARVFTAGASWWAVEWVRILGNLVVERFNDPLLAPEPGRKGNYVTLLARVQVAVP